ncbi:MAG: sulfite reductase [Gammaproteobacteria bacterium]|jgi:sulfite reductase (NADPH) hemoprotein beta-component|nr:sulfite reductase [Gammaproteobacteria bacterium]|tara:strand:- start:6155 stop:7807 length:1653 start_codon:yes stop_codon:yes gene_type:complete
MYQYSTVDQRLVEERVEQFRDQTRRFIDGQLSEEAYLPLRLMNGVYIQRHSPMLRIAIPYGLLSSDQLRKLAHIARTYDRGFGHLTTRQNIQFNWPKLEQVPDILADLATVQMHAIQTSGNCIRNTTADHLAGAIAGELEDPRPYCELIRQWSTFHPEFTYLPRKFKIAVSGTENDRAATQVHDIGIQILQDPASNEVGFRILVGGGLGRTPVIAKVVRDFLPKKHLFSYLEAILRVYNLAGRRDNKHKARIKILVNSLGIERFTELVEEEWLQLKDSGLALDDASIKQMQAHFQPFEYAPETNGKDSVAAKRSDSPAFSAWYEHNTQPHRLAGYRIVTLSVKAPEQPPGDLTHEQMDGVAELSDKYSFGQIRVSHEQNLIFADVLETDLHTLWLELVKLELATPNIGCLTDVICCPGLDYCGLANATAIPIAKQISAHFDDMDYLYDLGEIKIKISGCMNACGHHHVGHIGILGVDKKGEEWYQITLGGSSEENASLGKIIGKAVAKNDVAKTIAIILDTFVAQRQDQESFLDAVHRLGIAPFKDAVYG